MPGRKPKIKGNKIEAEIVNLHKEIGVWAQRVPLSGAAGGSFSGDVHIEWVGDPKPLKAEVKARKSGAGFVQIEKWLGTNNVLFLRKDRAEPLVVLPWKTWKQLIKKIQ